MIVGYRRGAGKVGLTNKEIGTRGTWAEKRRDLLQRISAAGHDIQILSPLTPPTTEALGTVSNPNAKVDLLIVEFAGLNWTFFGDEWEETIHIIKQHTGNVVFVCDDPDLPFPWAKMPDEDWSRWTIATNSTQEQASRTILKVPTPAQWVDFSMPTTPQLDFNNGLIPAAVYIGRPNSRAAMLKKFLDAPIHVAGKPKEWEEYNFHRVDAPQQSNRKQFYRRYRACLAFYDKKHEQSGWRTGRAYHALAAGIPVIAPVGNPALNWTYTAEATKHVKDFIAKPRQEREHIWQQQTQTANTTTPLEAIGL